MLGNLFKDVYVWHKLQPYIRQLKGELKEMHIKFSWNVLAQVVGTVAQIANVAGQLVPAKYQGTLAAGIGALQGIAAFLAHFSTPQGTSIPSASTPTTPTSQQG